MEKGLRGSNYSGLVKTVMTKTTDRAIGLTLGFVFAAGDLVFDNEMRNAVNDNPDLSSELKHAYNQGKRVALFLTASSALSGTYMFMN